MNASLKQSLFVLSIVLSFATTACTKNVDELEVADSTKTSESGARDRGDATVDPAPTGTGEEVIGGGTVSPSAEGGPLSCSNFQFFGKYEIHIVDQMEEITSREYLVEYYERGAYEASPLTESFRFNRLYSIHSRTLGNQKIEQFTIYPVKDADTYFGCLYRVAYGASALYTTDFYATHESTDERVVLRQKDGDRRIVIILLEPAVATPAAPVSDDDMDLYLPPADRDTSPAPVALLAAEPTEVLPVAEPVETVSELGLNDLTGTWQSVTFVGDFGLELVETLKIDSAGHISHRVESHIVLDHGCRYFVRQIGDVEFESQISRVGPSDFGNKLVIDRFIGATTNSPVAIAGDLKERIKTDVYTCQDASFDMLSPYYPGLEEMPHRVIFGSDVDARGLVIGTGEETAGVFAALGGLPRVHVQNAKTVDGTVISFEMSSATNYSNLIRLIEEYSSSPVIAKGDSALKTLFRRIE